MSRSILLSGALVVLLAGCGDNSSSGSFEYVALGASDATGIGASPLDEGYVFEIQEGLQSDGRDVGLLNLGIPGGETDEINNFALSVAIDEEPELVTIFTGANDIISGLTTADFQNDLSEILDELANNTEALVVIGTIPDLTGLPRFQENPDDDVTTANINAYNDIIRTEAARTGALIADLAAEPIDSFEVSDDGFHPNDVGHQVIADIFLSVIRPALAGR